MKNLNKILKFLVYILPLCLVFSYWPVMHFGSSESMNFEISVPLIWLVVFDVVAFVIMVRRKMLFRGFGKKWLWLLLPVWLSLSAVWSLNSLRGLLVVGILWLVYFAGYGMWQLRSTFDEEFRRRWWKWFFGAALFVCAWCVVQCVLNLAGVAREWSLMCAGCTYRSFGFPHPNGFAVEPQFMGNLLLAPLMVSIYFVLKNKKYWWVVAILAFGLFLTFSRGAIYAFIVGLVVMSAWMGAREWKNAWRRIGVVWVTVVVAFLVALGAQGVMAEVSPTNDTFQTGVAKVLNHLSLGVVDLRGDMSENGQAVESGELVVEKPVENSGENRGGGEDMEVVLEGGGEEAAFDGYVAESTEVRMKLTGAALEVWQKDFATMAFGVGIGGAGQALYANGLTSTPKEIVQNEYASLLLESGVVGAVLFVLTLVIVVRGVWKSKGRVAVLSLLIAYAVTLCFFSGLPNALQVYLLPVVLCIFI